MRSQMDWMVLCGICGAALMPGCGMQNAQGEPDLSEGAPASLERAPASQVAASCSQESDCGAGLACVAGACQACFGHDQCESDVCDRGAATPKGPGACVPEASVIYVDARAPRPECFTADGTRANPVCDIRFAIPLAFGARYAIRVLPGHYFPFSATSRTVYVFGPADGTAIVGEEDISRGASITGGSRVVIDGLDFDIGVLNGVICDSSNLKVLRGTLHGDSIGIRSTSCDLEIDQVRATGARTGLQLAGTGTYRITNSYFVGGDLPSVVFSGSASGLFAFNTVTGGGEIQPGGIDCGTTPRVIQDSIVMHNFPAIGGAQTVGACIHQRVVVGSGDTRPDPGLIAIDPDLPQGRLIDTPANRACCIDRGARYVPSLYRDFFGIPRPQGASNDIGASEFVP